MDVGGGGLTTTFGGVIARERDGLNWLGMLFWVIGICLLGEKLAKLGGRYGCWVYAIGGPTMYPDSMIFGIN